MFLKEGIVLKSIGKRFRTILTLEGEISFKRSLLIPADPESKSLLEERYGLKTVAPLDMALGIDRLPFKISVYMMLDIAKRAINAHSYAELQKAYSSDRDIKISDDMIRFVIDELGGIVFDYDIKMKDRALAQFAEAEKSNLTPAKYGQGILYIEMDGAMFNTRTTNGGSSWRENKLGVVFNSLDILYRITKSGKEASRILKREYISYVGDADTFKAFVYALAKRNGIDKCAKVVIISDGAKWIKGFKETYCQGMDVLHILDFSHLKENIYKFSKAHIRGTKQKDIWARTMIELIYDGQIEAALEMAEPYKDKKREGIPNIYYYIINNRNSIDYPAYLAANLFIGSGMIESGNRYVMQGRLKLPGMRWNVESAQRLMALKCKFESDLWDKVVTPLVFSHYGLKPEI